MIAQLARNLNTSIPDLEAMRAVDLIAYHEAMVEVLRAENAPA